MKIKFEELSLAQKPDLVTAIHICAKQNGSGHRIGLTISRYDTFIVVHCDYHFNNPIYTVGYYSVLAIVDYLYMQGKIKSATGQSESKWFCIRVEKEDEEKLIEYLTS